MVSNKKNITVSILEKKYSLLTDESEELVSQAALLVESLLRQMVQSSASGSISPAEMVKRTTFVALKIAVDLLKQSSSLDEVYGKVNVLNNILNDALSG
jgi:cell division protein ZapA (FtsZ GTPase activity inhibitor)